MYVFDTNVFILLGQYYPSRFPTIWAKIDELADNDVLRSVKEVRRELEQYNAASHISEWVRAHSALFLPPTEDEMCVVAEIFRKEQYRGFVKRSNLLKGMPVADPFVVAAGKVHSRKVVTQEADKAGAARIPTACREFGVKCMTVEEFLELENLKY